MKKRQSSFWLTFILCILIIVICSSFIIYMLDLDEEGSDNACKEIGFDEFTGGAFMARGYCKSLDNEMVEVMLEQPNFFGFKYQATILEDRCERRKRDLRWK